MTKTRKPPKATAAELGESSDSDVPLAKKLAKEKEVIEKRAETEAKAIRAGKKTNGTQKAVKEEDSDDDVPLAKKKKGTKAPPKKKAIGKVKDDESEDDAPLSRKTTAGMKGNAAATAKPAAKGKGKKAETQEDAEAEEEEEEYRWWEDPTKGDGTKKWTTLQHNGVVFPPPYERLPKNVKMKYNGIAVTLAPEAEEVATFYGSMLNSTVNVTNPTFNKNFFEDFQTYLNDTGHSKDRDGKTVKIKEFEKCDFNPIFEWFDAERTKKKALSAAEKKVAKAEREKIEAPYMYCLWDGRKQKVGNFRVEPPGLFRGRGEHPKTGRVKKRVKPEQITINIGKEATVPPPPEGSSWKEIKHDSEGTWLAMWQENINGAYKYVMLAANSDVKGQSDHKKFEKARELKKHIDRIREDYNRDLRAEKMADRQLATAVYLIDRLALRAGNEKGEDEADTVGCCSLKYEHVTLKQPDILVFDFLGKDSIRYYDEVKVDPQVFKNIKLFKKAPKADGDEIFDRLTTSSLNKHLSGYMAGLTAKVFRTYNASWTMANLLKDMKLTGTVHEKFKAYNDANRKVAILCNHKRTVGAGHAGQMEKMQEKINGLHYQQWRIRQMILNIEPKQKKKKGAEYFELPEGIDVEWVKEHQAFLTDELRTKIEKKFQKDNEKLVADGGKAMKDSELKERQQAVAELADKFKQENKTKKVEPDIRGASVEKLEANIEKLTQRIEVMKLQAEDKDNNKEVALGTSKIVSLAPACVMPRVSINTGQNYIDPRLSVVFSKKSGVPLEKLFSKTLRDKFDWAIKSVDEDWEF